MPKSKDDGYKEHQRVRDGAGRAGRADGRDGFSDNRRERKSLQRDGGREERKQDENVGKREVRAGGREVKSTGSRHDDKSGSRDRKKSPVQKDDRKYPEDEEGGGFYEGDFRPNDSGYGGSFDGSFRGGGAWFGRGFYNGGRGGHYQPEPGFGRGGRWPRFNGPGFGMNGWGYGHSTPKERRGGRGGFSKGDSTGSGTANEILAKRVKELEEQVEMFKKQIKDGTPKDKTLEELKNLSAKHSKLKVKAEQLSTLLDGKNVEISQNKEMKNILENFTMSSETKAADVDGILINCSARVKKHMKIIIENKLGKADLQNSLKLLLMRMDGDSIWAEIISLIKKIDIPALTLKLIRELGGEEASESTKPCNTDSAPSGTDSEEEEHSKLEPTKLFNTEVKEVGIGKEVQAKMVDDATMEKIKERKGQALELKKKRQREAIEE